MREALTQAQLITKKAVSAFEALNVFRILCMWQEVSRAQVGGASSPDRGLVRRAPPQGVVCAAPRRAARVQARRLVGDLVRVGFLAVYPMWVGPGLCLLRVAAALLRPEPSAFFAA